MKTSDTLVVITTYNREEGCFNLLESIDHDSVDVLVVACGQDESKYDFSKLPDDMEISIISVGEKRPVVYNKKEGSDFALKHKYDHLFIIEDDVIIKDNNVWGYIKDFSRKTGLQHVNWNEAAPNKLLKTYEIDTNTMADIHLNAQGCFQYFTKRILPEVVWDLEYINAFEHGDVEYDLHLKGWLPPFWSSVSPKGLSEYLTYDDQGESTITQKDGYQENVLKSLNHWKTKWGLAPNEIKPTEMNKIMRKLEIIRKKYGEYNKAKKYTPISIVVTIKNRCHLLYKTNNDLLPHELQIMKQHDQVMSGVLSYNENREGIELNQKHMSNPDGFRLFESFVKSINEQAHRYEGKVELVVSDWESTDDDVEEIIQAYWDFEYTLVKLPKDEKFSRGYGLNESIKASKYDHIHISDVDMVYKTPKFLEDCSKLNGEAIFPIIAKQVSPSGLFLYMEIAGHGIASMEKDTFNRAGGFDDIRKWGGEDNKLFERVDKVLGKENVKRFMYPECVHRWHSDITRK